MTDTENQLSALLESTRSDRLIKLYVGPTDDDRPFLIQQTVLETASDYFKNALKHEDSVGDTTERGVLHLKEDDKEAWTILIFWMLKNELPTCATGPVASQMLLVKCWILGDKYMIPAFQDNIMLELLHIMDGTGETIKIDVARVAISQSAPGSILRRLAADELMCAIFIAKDIKLEEVDCLDGIPGLASTLLEAVTTGIQRQRSGKQDDFGVIPDRMNSALWKDYMVGDGPKKHWIWDQ